jgi:peptidoglycan/xylan/chitin deacetylase (PgdA/CDA1 family)
LFLLKLCPEAAATLDYGNNYPFDLIVKSGDEGNDYARRVLLLRAAAEARNRGVEFDMSLVHDSNYAARRGALYLLYSAIPRDADRMLVWLKLRESANDQLMRMVVSYL